LRAWEKPRLATVTDRFDPLRGSEKNSVVLIEFAQKIVDRRLTLCMDRLLIASEVCVDCGSH